MTTQRIAELEAEVLRLREALKRIKYETDIHGNNLNRGIKDEAVKALSTPFTPTALNELIEKVERRTIERCAVVAEELRHPDGFSGENVDWCAGTDHAAAQEEIKTVTEQKNRMWFEMQTAQDQLAKAEQRVAEACALQVATETKFHWLDAARVAKEIRSGEWRKFVKEV